ncbi:MAG TPA: hypothetical protein VNE39_08100 [Planctomycetota bacterium]|nr:hypothetical protein [Planctomycetota bacterium]
MAGHTVSEWKGLSKELDREAAGAPENTQPLTGDERRWYRMAVADTGPKVRVTIRLRKWQIERAKELARQQGIRGYQSLIDRILTKELLP